jgi:hypothetical protein
MPDGKSPAEADHPGVQVLAPGLADRNHPSVAVGILRIAVDRTAADPVVEGLRGPLSAAIGSPAGILAGLPALWCIDPKQADPLASDLDRVTIDDRGATDDHVRPARGRENKQESREGNAHTSSIAPRCDPAHVEITAAKLQGSLKPRVAHPPGRPSSSAPANTAQVPFHQD